MAFHGSSFIFDGISCEEFHLMLYTFGDKGQSDAQLVTRELFEDRVARSYVPLYYGSSFNRPLEFDLVFGQNPKLIDQHTELNRWDMEAISAWLTGPEGYRDLVIVQEDLEAVHFKSIISDLQQISLGGETWALSCKVRCDSPYGYLSERVFTYEVVNQLNEAVLYNRSSHCGYYYPKVKITLPDPMYRGDRERISIVNETDGGREFLLDIPNEAPQASEIIIDGQRGVIENDAKRNLYDCFNYNFFRLLRGKNIIHFSGRFTADIICEFPVNVGG